MLKVIEVIGISEVSFSEAVRSAIQELSKDGKNAHFFEVIEQRGSVRDSRLKEFQVKLKVAID